MVWSGTLSMKHSKGMFLGKAITHEQPATPRASSNHHKHELTINGHYPFKYATSCPIRSEGKYKD